MSQNLNTIKSELDFYKNYNINTKLFEINKYIQKLLRRIRDKQEYINFLTTVIKENNISFDKKKFKEFKKSKYIDKYEIEKEELSSCCMPQSREAPEKVKDPESNSKLLSPGEKINFYPLNEMKMCEGSLVGLEENVSMTFKKINNVIMQQPLGLGVSQVCFKENNIIELTKWGHSTSSAVVKEEQEEPKEENIEEEDEYFKDIKNKIDKMEFKELNQKYVGDFDDFTKTEIKNLLNYLKRKMKKKKSGFDKIEYCSFKAALEYLFENASA